MAAKCYAVCVCEHNTCVLAVSSMHEGEMSQHCNSSGSNGIHLMTKLIEGLTPAGADKAADSVSVYTVCAF